VASGGRQAGQSGGYPRVVAANVSPCCDRLSRPGGGCPGCWSAGRQSLCQLVTGHWALGTGHWAQPSPLPCPHPMQRGIQPRLHIFLKDEHRLLHRRFAQRRGLHLLHAFAIPVHDGAWRMLRLVAAQNPGQQPILNLPERPQNDATFTTPITCRGPTPISISCHFSGSGSGSVSVSCRDTIPLRRWTLDVGRWTLDVGRWTFDVRRSTFGVRCSA
jgi:hypothetical protein